MANLLKIKYSFIQFKARATTTEACAFPISAFWLSKCLAVLQRCGLTANQIIQWNTKT